MEIPQPAAFFMTLVRIHLFEDTYPMEVAAAWAHAMQSKMELSSRPVQYLGVQRWRGTMKSNISHRASDKGGVVTKDFTEIEGLTSFLGTTFPIISVFIPYRFPG